MVNRFMRCYSKARCKYLGHLLAVGLGVEGSFSQEDGVLFRSNTQFVVEGVMPDLLHVIPVGDDTVLDRVFHRQNTTFRLGLVADVAIFLPHAHHDSLKYKFFRNHRDLIIKKEISTW